ncbi:MAG TPA: SusC/RagA family TonB-linked outer membrane protein [Puia sp.]|nr:SusC/RagA family TonB-linked outer membrane protein [Puia sp.]
MRKFLTLFAVLVLCSILAFAQTKVVTGRVTDAQGQPVPFASIRIKSNKQGVSADADGNYTIRIKPGDVLVVSGTGVTQKEFPVGNESTLNLNVVRTASSLTEVVVTSLGIKKEAKALGYSTATINSDVLNVAKPVNVAQGLMGQVSGAQISIIDNGVDPQIRVQLRGERHLSSDNQPLFVVDGMQVRSDYIITINPEDVESETVLKGATAAALYGSEATNGVIIITTKKGSKNGKPMINVSQTATFEKLAYFPALQTTYSGYGGEVGTFFGGTPYEFQGTNPYTGFTNYIPFENQQFGPAFDGNPANAYIGIPNENGDVQKVPFAAQSTDPRKQFFQTGFTSQTDVSISNGDSRNSNFIGLQYVDVKGVVPKDQSKRASVRFNGRRTYGIFSYDFSMAYAYKYSNTVGNDMTAGWPLYWTLLNTPANIPMAALKDWQDYNSWGNLSHYYNAYYINPWWQVDNSREINKQDNIQGVLTANLKPTNWFTATYRLGALVTSTIFKAYRNQATFSPWAQDAYGPPIYGTPYSGNIAGAVEDKTMLQKRIQQDIYVTLQKQFNDFTGTLILGNTIWDRFANTQIQSVGNGIGDIPGSPQSQTSGLILPDVYNIASSFGIPNIGDPITSSNTSGTTQGVTEARLVGWYADATVDYNSFLFLHGNYRRDYSSLLAPGNNSYDVYGVDASWIFSDNLFKNNNLLSYGKLRAAYSHTGQITLPSYATVNTFSVPSPYPYGGLAALSLNSTYNNPANVPEATNEIEGGLELGFMHNRVKVGATYYHDKNFNQLFQVALTNSTGFSSAFVNAAQTTSKGWEFDASVTAVRTKDWKWDIGGNLAIQETVVDQLYGSGSNATKQTGIGNSNEAIVGMTFPQMYVYDLTRDSATGKVIVNSTTGLPSVGTTPIAVGRTTPKYILGLNTTVTYKDVTLNIIGDYRGGYVFYNNAEQNLDFTGASAHTASNGRQNFIYPNSEVMQNGKLVPNSNTYVQDGNIGFWVYSDYRKAGTSYVENAAAWKIRTINITYDFTRLIVNNTKQKALKGAKLSAICNNVLMLRPKENDFTDPEFNNGNVNGLGYNTYYQLPPTRQFTFVLSLNF